MCLEVEINFAIGNGPGWSAATEVETNFAIGNRLDWSASTEVMAVSVFVKRSGRILAAGCQSWSGSSFFSSSVDLSIPVATSVFNSSSVTGRGPTFLSMRQKKNSDIWGSSLSSWHQQTGPIFHLDAHPPLIAGVVQVGKSGPSRCRPAQVGGVPAQAEIRAGLRLEKLPPNGRRGREVIAAGSLAEMEKDRTIFDSQHDGADEAQLHVSYLPQAAG